MKASTLVLLGIGGLVLYELAQQSSILSSISPVAGSPTTTSSGGLVNTSGSPAASSSLLPPGAIFVEQISALGGTVNVYMDSNGYYAALLGANSEPVRVWGPYSQNQVYTILDLKNALSNL
jgi:hypothetical protein